MSWRGLLVTLIFLAYSFSLTTLFLDAFLTGEMPERVWWGLDIGYMAFMPIFGFLLDPASFRYRREDTYSRKLAEWHTMPIGVGQIIAGRLTVFLLVLVFNCLLYFGLQYAVLEELRDQIGLAGFFINLLCWFGYGVVTGVMTIYLELGFSGRDYFNYFCIFFVFGILLTALLLNVFGANAVSFFLESAAEGSWGTAAAMLAAAAAAVAGFGALLHRRINRRSFWS